MYRPNSQSPYPPNAPYQQLQSHQSPRSYQQQQFGPRFQSPPQQFTPPGSFYPPPQLNQDHSRPPYQGPIPPQLNQDHQRPPYQGPVPPQLNQDHPRSPYPGPIQPQLNQDHPRPPYPGPIQPQPFYQPTNPNFDQTLKPLFQPPMQSFETLPNPSYRSHTESFDTPPNTQFPPPSPGSSCSQLPISPYRPGQTFEPTIPNFNQPPPVQNYNQSPVQNYNNHVPVQNYNQPPPVQNYNQPITPYQPVNQNGHQPMGSLYNSPGYGSTLNSSYQTHINSSEPLKQPYQLSSDQCYRPQQPSFNSPPRNDFNQRPPFRHPGTQRFAFKNQNNSYQQSQHSINRFQFHPRQQYQNYRPRGPSVGFNHSMSNNAPKTQIACEMGDCDFVGHASAVKEHQNLHHRLGLHKKVLYSNNSDAIKNWIEERKKKWPTKENIQTKLEVEDEKNKRGERIADEDFQRFNNKKNKFNKSETKRFNNRKRPRFNGEFVEPVEEPMNGKLKRFSGIIEIKTEDENNSFTKEDENISFTKEDENNSIAKEDESKKPVALKMLEEYEESSNQSDDEPPEETAIIKESISPDDTKIPNEESTSKLEDTMIKNSETIDSASLVKNDSKTVSIEIKNENYSKVDEKIVSGNGSQKRKRDSKKEFKPSKKQPPPRTPRTEVVERKGALLEALMGDLMRSERNTITQCICYIRNNMHRFCKIQAA